MEPKLSFVKEIIKIFIKEAIGAETAKEHHNIINDYVTKFIEPK